MSATVDRVLLFPGQGAFRGAELPELAARHPEVRQVFSEIDRVARRLGAEEPSGYVLDAVRPLAELAREAPAVLQLAIYGTSIAVWTVLRARGEDAGVLAGHSAGEIAALVAGGAFSVAEGAEIVAQRSAVLAATGSNAGGMLALACDADRGRRIVEAVGEPRVAVAVRNGSRQIVLAGPSASLETAAAVARALGVGATPLPVAYPFHSPVLAQAVPEFAARIRHIEPRPLRTLVFSPILGRFHRPEDALCEHVATALVAPVAFDRALDRLAEAGARTFVECSTAGTLTRIVKRCRPQATVLLALAGLDSPVFSPRRAPDAAVAAVENSARP
jgi:acyl transferase domain-containing protein